MQNKKRINSETQRSWWQRYHIFVFVAAIILLWLIFDIFIGGNIRFYSRWVECGQKPVALVPGSGLFGVGVPHYYVPSYVSLIRGPIDYSCTAHEAELGGYSANERQYEFKYTTPGERYKNYTQHNQD